MNPKDADDKLNWDAYDELNKRIAAHHTQAVMKAHLAQRHLNILHSKINLAGNIIMPPASITQPPSKQPQDGVIRMVSSKNQQELAIGGAEFYQALVGVIGALGGITVHDFGWLGLGFLVPAGICFYALRWNLIDYFKNAQAKADLLDWPKQ